MQLCATRPARGAKGKRHTRTITGGTAVKFETKEKKKRGRKKIPSALRLFVCDVRIAECTYKRIASEADVQTQLICRTIAKKKNMIKYETS